MKLSIIFLILVIFSAFSFADMGPSPEPPNVVVSFKNFGQTYNGPVSLQFHCTAPTSSSPGSPLFPRNLAFSCSNGVCNSDGLWFYKFNPCFYPTGYFIYAVGDEPLRNSSVFSFNDSSHYNITIDLATGSSTSSKDANNRFCCISFIPLFVILIVSSKGF